MQSKILEKFINSFENIYFDASNHDHLVFAKNLIFNIEQDKVHRFILEEGFQTIPQMMMVKITQQHLQGIV